MTSLKATPPARPRLPTAAEADLMSGEAFLEAFREANEAERKKKQERGKP